MRSSKKSIQNLRVGRQRAPAISSPESSVNEAPTELPVLGLAAMPITVVDALARWVERRSDKQGRPSIGVWFTQGKFRVTLNVSASNPKVAHCRLRIRARQRPGKSLARQGVDNFVHELPSSRCAHQGSVSALPQLLLRPDDIHVWWINLEQSGVDAATVLSTDERARAERFNHPQDRARWTSARVAVRQILARYTGDHPAALRLTYGPCLKPALVGSMPLRFSLAHARERAALAVAWEREVGIDLEPIDPGLAVSPLLGVVCSQTEIARLDALPPPARLHAFLAYWTLKEAYLKGTGAGLSRDPRTIEVEPLPEGRAAVRDTGIGVQAQHWSVRLLDAGPGWIAALASSVQARLVLEYDWPRPKTTHTFEGQPPEGHGF